MLVVQSRTRKCFKTLRNTEKYRYNINLLIKLSTLVLTTLT